MFFCYRWWVDDFLLFHCLCPFVFLWIEFHCTFYISYKIFCHLYVDIFCLLNLYFFRRKITPMLHTSGSDKLVCFLIYCLSQLISHGMWLLAWGRVDDFSYSIVKNNFVIEFRCTFFDLLPNTNKLCLLLLYLIRIVYSLTFFGFFVLFHSCCSHARVFRKTPVHEFLISYSHTEWHKREFGARWRLTKH